MNRNQKIALGCGGAGCLGLIVVAIAGGLIYFFMRKATPTRRDYNYNVSTNRDTNRNDNSNLANNTNDNSSSTSTSSMSEDDKHKLYQAAGTTGDAELIRRVSVKIGLMDEDYTPGDNYQQFMAEHLSWAVKNYDFIQSINTPEKARAYVNANFPE